MSIAASKPADDTRRSLSSQAMPRRSGVRTSTVNGSILAALIITALYVGKIVFLPIAAAILFAFVCAPIVRALRYLHIPRLVAVILVVGTAFISLVLVGSALSEQLRQLASEFPRYEQTLREKVRDVRGAAMSSPAMERAAETLKDLQEELEKPSDQKSKDAAEVTLQRVAPGSLTARAANKKDEPKPIPVEIHYPNAKPLESLVAFVTPLLEPIAMLAVIIVLVLFILMQKEELRDRFIRLSGSQDMQRTTAAMSDAGQRLSRFLLTMTALNTAYGFFIGVAMWWLGIPAPVLWGILATLMRFVPILGSFIAAAFPVALAAAVDPGWGTFFITAGLFIFGEAVMGQVLEPLVQGKSTGLSPLAILVAAAFWTFLWGPAGLLLAIPMTLCLVVLGQHVDSLRFLHVMLGDEPALTQGERFYQRTLAGDATEITDLAERFSKQMPLSVYYQDVAIEGLRLAQADADRGLIENDHMEVIEATVETMVDNLWENADRAPDINNHAKDNGSAGADERGDDEDDDDEVDMGTSDLPFLEPEELPEAWRRASVVACIPAQSRIDRAGAHILCHLINRHGIDADVVEASKFGHATDSQSGATPQLVCICSLSEQLAPTRYLARRLARRLKDARIVVVLCGADVEKAEAFGNSAHDVINVVTRDLREAVSAVIAQATSGGVSDVVGEDDSTDAAAGARDTAAMSA
jgi:predicted PurR-regulated permease PerM